MKMILAVLVVRAIICLVEKKLVPTKKKESRQQ